MPSYPEKLEIAPLSRPPTATVRVPGSKSITNRALVLAALHSATTECELKEALCSEDTELMVASLHALGYTVEPHWVANPLAVEIGPMDAYRRNESNLSAWPPRSADLFVANSGTSMRFLACLVSLGKGRYRLDGIPRMRERPIQDLLDALQAMGVNAYSEAGNGCPPVLVESSGFLKGEGTRVRGDVSSQFLSALMMVAPLACRKPASLLVDGPLVSKPYVEMTLAMMGQWGATWRQPKDGYIFTAESLNSFGNVKRYEIEPFASAASYFFAAAALMGGQVAVAGLPENSLQGDVHFVDVLAEMGCRVERGEEGITVHGGPLRGIDADMNDISDTVMTLAAVACFAEGPTTIRNVAHIRHKETDRLAALAAELRRVGAGVDEFADGLTITPRPLHGAEIETYNDHRMAMSMALIGLRVPGIVLKNPGCVAKTYPSFFADLEKLR